MCVRKRSRAPFLMRDDEGSISVIALVASVALVAAAALSVDVGTFFLAKRKQQAATDIAAIVGAGQLGQATSAVQQALASNGLDPATLQTIEYGAYQADPQLPAAQRFQITPQASANAVRVTVRSVAPMYFGSVFFPPAAAAPTLATPGVQISTQATAAQANFASFAIGSQLASLNGGLLNALLGSLLGSSLSLSLMDYQALASAQFDAFTFSQLLAARIGMQGASYAQLASANVHFGDVLLAMAGAVGAAGGSAAATNALVGIATANLPAANTMTVGALLSFGPFSSMTVGTNAPTSTSLGVLDAVTMVAQIAGQGRQVSVGLGGMFPGLASLTLTLAIGQPPAQSSFVSIGRVGAQVRTSQTRLGVVAQVPALSPLLTFSLPLYLQLASASATLSSLSCGPGAGTPAAILNVQPSVGDVWIGNTSAAAFADFSQSPSIQPAAIASVFGAIGIYGLAHATVGNTTPTPVAFSSADIAGQVKHLTTTTDFTSGLVESLAGKLQLSLFPTGGSPPAVPAATAVAQNLARAAPAIDQALGSILTTLGLELGNADTWIAGVRCGGGVLVN